MMVNLANEMQKRGIQVDILYAAGECPHPELLSSGVGRVNFDTKHVYGALFPLVDYLKKQGPDVLLAVRHRAINLAFMAHHLAGNKSSRKLVLRLAGNIASSIESKNRLRKWMHWWPIRRIYPRFDAIITVSGDLAREIKSSTSVSPEKVFVVPNPSIPADIEKQAEENVEHDWLQNKECPVVMGLGRLTRRKDFQTLIRAFALVVKKRFCRLIIVGDGQERENCRTLARELGISEYVDFQDFKKNPYPYIAASDLLVLSSYGSEGSPNVLKEGLSLGVPVVSTDCPSGPREILQDGKYGRLVPIQDPESMSVAIEETLQSPPNRDFLKSAIQKYTVSNATQEYIRVFNLNHSLLRQRSHE